MEAVAAVGLVASISSLVEVTAKIVARLHDFGKQTSDVPETFRSLADRLPLLISTLKSINARAEAGHIEDTILTDLERLITSVSSEISYLQQCLGQTTPPVGASRLTRTIKGLKSLVKDEKLQQAIGKIHHGIDIILLHQTTSVVDSNDRILQQLTQLKVTESPPTQRTFGLCLSQAPQIEPDAFIGREGELEQLHQWLSPDANGNAQKVVSIVGMGGLGKTQLSLAFARKYGEQYSSVFYISARDERILKQDMAALNELISANNSQVTTTFNDEHTQVTEMRQWLSEEWNNRWLLILDNYDDPNLPNIRSTTGFDIRAFFPTRSHGHILITTRSPKLTFTKALMLQKLNDVDTSIAVLSQRSGRELTADPSAQHLAARLDGLPLALAMAGVYIGQTGVSCAEYLQAYEAMWLDLHGPASEELLEYEDRRLSSTYVLSYEKIQQQDPDAAELLKLLGYLSNEDIWYELVQAGVKNGPSWLSRVAANKLCFNRTVNKLRDYSLIEVGVKSYSLHTCIQDWATEHFNLKSNEDLFHAAMLCVSACLPAGDSFQFGHTGKRLLKHMDRLCSTHFRSLCDGYGTSILELDALKQLGIISLMTHRKYMESLCKQTISGYESLYGIDHQETLLALRNLAAYYMTFDRLAEAEQILLQVLSGYDRILGCENSETLIVLGDLGEVYLSQKRWSEAESALSRSVEGLQTQTGRHLMNSSLFLAILGNMYLEQGQGEEAEQMYERALLVMERFDSQMTSYTLTVANHLGALYRQRDKFTQSEQLMTRIISARENSLRKKDKCFFGCLKVPEDGLVSKDEFEDAEQMFEEALAGYVAAVGWEHVDTLLTAVCFGGLHEAKGNLTKAEEMYSQSLVGCQKALGEDHILTIYCIGKLEVLTWERTEEAETKGP